MNTVLEAMTAAHYEIWGEGPLPPWSQAEMGNRDKAELEQGKVKETDPGTGLSQRNTGPQPALELTFWNIQRSSGCMYQDI